MTEQVEQRAKLRRVVLFLTEDLIQRADQEMLRQRATEGAKKDGKSKNYINRASVIREVLDAHLPAAII